jgi:hypothetical protein
MIPRLILASMLVTAASSAATFDVNFNTGPLTGTQTLAFALTDGAGVNDNTVTLTNFAFGGETAGGAPTYQGSGISGDLAGGVTLTDKDFLELFSQPFHPGSSLSFRFTTTDSFSGGSPDAFQMYLCDATFTTCYSDDPVTSSLLTLQLTGTPLTTSSVVLNGASAQRLNSPSVTSVPEPRFAPLAGLFIAVLALAARRRPPFLTTQWARTATATTSIVKSPN